MRDLCWGRRNELPSADIGVAGGGDTALNSPLRAVLLGGGGGVQGASERADTHEEQSHCLHAQAGGLELDSQLG
jgi:hypothetical protein